MLEKKILLTVLALFYKTKGAMFKVTYRTLNTTPINNYAYKGCLSVRALTRAFASAFTASSSGFF